MTGGGDLSLVEVSEASSIIQEAAHEEANIIFGAVVDPSMQGQVKITVIATGFERDGTTRAEPSTTPVDLQQYSSWTPEPQPEAVASRLSLARRPAVDLPLASAPASADGGPGSVQENPEEITAGVDVPAFLRRRSEA